MELYPACARCFTQMPGGQTGSLVKSGYSQITNNGGKCIEKGQVNGCSATLVFKLGTTYHMKSSLLWLVITLKDFGLLL